MSRTNFESNPARPKLARALAFGLAGVVLLSAVLVILALPKRPHTRPGLPLPVPAPRFKSALDDTFNILMTGRDARLLGDPSQDGKQRNRRENVYHSDVIIIAHFNLLLRRVTLVNIPRDMLVTIPGYSHPESRTDFCNLDKITHASAYGRDSLLIRTVEKFLGIRIRRRVALDFDSFRLLFAVLRPFLGKLAFGNRELNTPDSALMFVRDRHHYANDDLDRSRHSVLFVKTIVQRLWPRLNNRFLSALAPPAFGLIGPDTDLSTDDLHYIISELQHVKLNPDSIETAVLIGEEGPVTLWSYGQTLSCCLPNYEEIERQVAYYLRDQRNVPAFSFMEQTQKIRWPGYVFEDYDFMPETTAVDTANPVYQRLLMEKPQLSGRDSARLRHADSLARKDSTRTLPKHDTTMTKGKPGKIPKGKTQPAPQKQQPQSPPKSK